jgi:hypothetical protein
MAANWTSFLPGILPEVETCPMLVAQWAVRETAIKFLADTKIWQETQAPYTITSTPLSYEFVTATGSRVAQIMAAQVNGLELDILTPERCDEVYQNWRTGRTGTIEAVTQIGPDAFSVVPQPVATTSLLLMVALQPTRDAIDGPDFLFDDYYETICLGAKSRLMLMNEAEWANPRLAAIYGEMAADQLVQARSRRNRAFGRAVTRVRGQFL